MFSALFFLIRLGLLFFFLLSFLKDDLSFQPQLVEENNPNVGITVDGNVFFSSDASWTGLWAPYAPFLFHLLCDSGACCGSPPCSSQCSSLAPSFTAVNIASGGITDSGGPNLVIALDDGTSTGFVAGSYTVCTNALGGTWSQVGSSFLVVQPLSSCVFFLFVGSLAEFCDSHLCCPCAVDIVLPSGALTHQYFNHFRFEFSLLMNMPSTVECLFSCCFGAEM